MPMSPSERAGGLLLDGRHVGLPAEAAERRRRGPDVRRRGWRARRCRRRRRRRDRPGRRCRRPGPPRAGRGRTPAGAMRGETSRSGGERAEGRVDDVVGRSRAGCSSCRRRTGPRHGSWRDADRAPRPGTPLIDAVLELTAVHRVVGTACPSAPGTESRSSSPRSASSSASGGWARPSWKWHDEHDWALKIGPSPSRPSVDAGAVTQLSLKKLLPTEKARRSSRGRASAMPSAKALADDVERPCLAARASWRSRPSDGARLDRRSSSRRRRGAGAEQMPRSADRSGAAAALRPRG